MNPLYILGFLVVFGLLVVVPIVAIVSENKRKGGALHPPSDAANSDVVRRIGRMEAIVAAQQKQIEELKEQVHVNILRSEELSGLHQRLGERTDR